MAQEMNSRHASKECNVCGTSNKRQQKKLTIVNRKMIHRNVCFVYREHGSWCAMTEHANMVLQEGAEIRSADATCMLANTVRDGGEWRQGIAYRDS